MVNANATPTPRPPDSPPPVPAGAVPCPVKCPICNGPTYYVPAGGLLTCPACSKGGAR